MSSLHELDEREDTYWDPPNKPFDTALLSSAPTAHALAYNTPENLGVGVLSLLYSHLGDDLGQLFLFVFRPGSYKER